MAASDSVVQFVAAVLVFGIPLAFLTVQSARWGVHAVACVAAGATAAGASLVIDAVLSSPADGPARVLDAAIAGSVAATIAILAARRLGPAGGAVFAGLWSVMVYQPVFAATVGSVPSLVQSVFGAVDFAAVLASHVAAAASFLALTLLPAPLHANVMLARPSRSRSLLATALVIMGATAWMLGAERVISDATGRTATNAVVGMVVGAMVWVIIERVAGRSFSPPGFIAGAVVAWGSVGLGVPFLSPVALAATAVIATASAAAVAARGTPDSVHGRRPAMSVIVAVATGGVILALLADGFGMAATGSTLLVLGQLGAVLAIAIGAFGSGLLCGGAALVAIVAVERHEARRAHRNQVANRGG